MNRVGVLSQVASGGGWDTAIWLTNSTASPVSISLKFHGDAGNDMSIAYAATQEGDTEAGSGAALNRVINPNTTLVVATGSGVAANSQGWAEVSANGAVSGFGVFRYAPHGLDPQATGFITPWEGTVPLQTQLAATTMVLPFDNTGGFSTGFALGNLTAAQAVILATLYDESGSQLGSTQSISLNAYGHMADMVGTRWAFSANKRGIISFAGPAMTGLGLRASPYGALTSAPVALPGSLNGMGVLSQVASGGNWDTDIWLTNSSSAAIPVQLKFHGDSGGAVSLPYTVTQEGVTQTGTGSTLNRTIDPSTTLVLETGQGVSANVQGWAEVDATGALSGFAVFRYASQGLDPKATGFVTPWEGTVPLQTQVTATTMVLPFDNTGGFSTGFALGNLTAAQAVILATLYDENGSQLGSTQSISLNAYGHMADMVGTRWAFSANKRGIISFAGPAMTGLGLRASPYGALTSAPVALPGSLNGMGVLSQVASGGNWDTAIWLTNSSSAAIPVQLKFHGDSGGAVSLPYTVTQEGVTQTGTGSTLNRTIDPSTTLVLETGQGVSANVQGWAEVDATGALSGFAVFRYASQGLDPKATGFVTPWEGTVPLQTQVTATTMVLPFDNTGGFSTGFALGNLTAAQAVILATLYDENGSQLGSTQSISLNAYGHMADMVGTRWAFSANKRGIISFAGPAMTGLGLRASPYGALTSAPVALPGSLNGMGVLSQVASGGNWDTAIWLTNSSSAAIPVQLKFHGDSGGAVSLPYTVTQEGVTQTGTGSTLNRTIDPSTTLVLETGQGVSANVQGWAEVDATGALSGFAVFRYASQGLDPKATGFVTPWEGTVPLQTQVTATTMVLPFDNTGGFSTGFALGNLTAAQAVILATLYDENGSQLGSTQSISLNAYGHMADMVGTRWAFSANKRGIISFAGPAMTGLGLRASPYGALTSAPVALPGSLNGMGVLSQVASGGNWDTAIWLTNSSSAAIPVQLKFHGDSGGAVSLPYTVTQEGVTQTGTGSTLNRTIDPSTTLVLETGQGVSANVQGWAEVDATGALSGFAVFRYASQGLDPKATGFVTPWEGTVPLQTQVTATTMVLPFDNTGGFSTGFALGNLTAAQAVILATLYDENGSQLGSTQSISLNAYGHMADMVGTRWAFSANKRGIISFAGPAMTGLGLRASPYGALTSAPVALPGSLNGMGVLSQVASGGNWDTAIWLTNSSSAAIPVQLKFHGDSGGAVSLPYTVTQEGVTQTGTGSTLNRTIDPSTTLVLETGQGVSANVQGWAEVDATGALSGFAVFRYASQGLDPKATGSVTPWEGTVPLQTQVTATTMVLPFDNTGGFSTGFALGNLTAAQAAILATLYDENGSQLGSTQSISLNAYGHMADMVGTRWAFSANKRGIVKFTGAPMMGLGLRASPYGTLTSVPTDLQ